MKKLTNQKINLNAAHQVYIHIHTHTHTLTYIHTYIHIPFISQTAGATRVTRVTNFFFFSLSLSLCICDWLSIGRVHCVDECVFARAYSCSHSSDRSQSRTGYTRLGTLFIRVIRAMRSTSHIIYVSNMCCVYVCRYDWSRALT